MDIKSVIFGCLLSFGSCSIIIPEELPSLLSLAYSNIPPIKKGTDSRVGFGFAFGNHADFQVMFELGPQTNTLNLTGQPFPSSSSSSSSSNTKRQAPAPPKLNKNKEKYRQTDASKYLQSWAQKMRVGGQGGAGASHELPSLEDSLVELVKNDQGQYEIHQPKPGQIPQTVMESLKKLYGQKREEAMKLTGRRSEEEVKKITADLSDVDLD